MKLYYLECNNVGDRLNSWFWRELLPGVWDDNRGTVFLGIGTLINGRIYERVPDARNFVVFGTGFGYDRNGTSPLILDEKRWKIYFVRGPLSAHALGLEASKAITDPAALIYRWAKGSGEKAVAYSYMPHWSQAEEAGDQWRLACDELGFGFVDPRWDWKKVLDGISGTQVLLTEALHGAIFADSLRVPWVAVKSWGGVLEFKWRDWCASLGVEYKPVHIGLLQSGWREAAMLGVGHVSLSGQGGFKPLRDLSESRVATRASVRRWVDRKFICAQLRRLARESRPILSTDMLFMKRVGELDGMLERARMELAVEVR